MLKRVTHWLDDRLGISAVMLPIIRHPVPKNVNWWYVFGSSTLVVFVSQAVTGVLLAFTYVASPESARSSLLFISNGATFGSIIRGLHYWGASAMVILITLHVVRVSLMGSYKFPREMNWLVGVGLLFLTLAMAFTGQLLRWDQDAYWTAVVGAEQAGRVPFVGEWLAHLLIAGQTVGAQTLTRFYAIHVFLIPATLILFISVHLFLVVHHGISEPPKAGVKVDPETYRARYKELLKKDGVPFWPDAAWRDVVFAILIGAILMALAIFIGPKTIGEPADPTIVIASPRPDWYFLWYFAVLALIPPGIENWVMVGFPLLAIVGMIAVPFIGPKGERSPKRRPWVLAVVGAVALSIAVFSWEGTQSVWSPVLEATPIPESITRTMSSGAQRGANLFYDKGCISCHTVGNVGGKRGPNLTDVESRLSGEEMTWRILNGGTNMPGYGDSLTPPELEQLIEFLQSQKTP